MVVHFYKPRSASDSLDLSSVRSCQYPQSSPHSWLTVSYKTSSGTVNKITLSLWTFASSTVKYLLFKFGIRDNNNKKKTSPFVWLMIMAQNIKSIFSSDVTSSVNPSPISTNRLRGFFCNSPTVLHYIISLSFSAGLSLYQWVSTRGHFVPLGDIWQCLETLLIFTTEEEALPWASNRQRPGMLLNNLQYTEQVPTTKNYQAQNVNNVAMNTTSTQILVSNKRNQGSLEKGLILDVGQEKYVI